MTDNKIAISSAIACAIKELDLNNSEYEWSLEGKIENYYEFLIFASCMKYTVFVDDSSGYVSGIDSEPYCDLDSVYNSDNRYLKTA